MDKTKETAKLVSFLGDKAGILSWKLDGLTIVLKYNHGKLEQAVTRGNGEIGEDVTHNARVFRNVPLSIPFQGELVLRGEGVIPYSEFYRINEELGEEEQQRDCREAKCEIHCLYLGACRRQNPFGQQGGKYGLACRNGL